MKQTCSFNLILITFLCGCFSMVKNDSDFEMKIKNHAGLKLLPKDCGMFGYLKTEKQWLGVVTDIDGNFQCSGALISHKHLLFPGSCLRHKHFKIHLSYDECWLVNSCQPNESFDSHDVDVIFHSESHEYENNGSIDIAIIHLKTSINHGRDNLSSKFAVCLPINKIWYEHNLKIVGANGYELNEGTFHYARKVLKLYKPRVCSNKLQTVFSNETNFCTNTTNLENGATASRGMMMKKESRVVLYGMQLNSEISPEAYLFTRITNILPWILNTLAPLSFEAHRNYILFNDSCGEAKVGNRVAFGDNSEIFQYPWSALLKYSKDDTFSFRCGGSLISARYVLTAAHCVTKLKQGEKLVAVRLGEYDLSKELDCSDYDDPDSCAQPIQDILVEKYSIPEDFKDNLIGPNDIALIKLKVPFQKAKNVMPICLPFSKKLRDFKPKTLIVVGWGHTESGRSSDILQEATLSVVSFNECRKYFASKPVTLTDEQFCAGHNDSNISSCKGDSGQGSYAVTDFNNSPKIVQYGIVSAGIFDCGKFASFGIYTKITSFLEWILNNVEI